jgi:hypothetical protein
MALVGSAASANKPTTRSSPRSDARSMGITSVRAALCTGRETVELEWKLRFGVGVGVKLSLE